MWLSPVAVVAWVNWSSLSCFLSSFLFIWIIGGRLRLCCFVCSCRRCRLWSAIALNSVFCSFMLSRYGSLSLPSHRCSRCLTLPCSSVLCRAFLSCWRVVIPAPSVPIIALGSITGWVAVWWLWVNHRASFGSAGWSFAVLSSCRILFSVGRWLLFCSFLQRFLRDRRFGRSLRFSLFRGIIAIVQPPCLWVSGRKIVW